MSEQKNRCPHCGSIIDKREITMFRGLVEALWKVYSYCLEKNKHEFTMKEVRDWMDSNQYARFGDWVLFGGLVYKKSKAHYGLNMIRCDKFFKQETMIPIKLLKDPLTGTVEVLEYGSIKDIKGLSEFLDNDGLYLAKYRPSQNGVLNL